MNILFDLDGTLTDPFEGITKCIAYAIVELGGKKPNREDLRWCIGPPLKNSLATLLDTDDDALAEKALSLYRERFSSVGLFENNLYAGIIEALNALIEEGHALYVATAKPAVYAERIIEHFDLGRYFHSVYGSDLDGTRNDKAELIAHILGKESIAGSDTIMIGDRKHDMIGAKANGVSGIGVLWGFGTQEELEKSGARRCISHPGDIVGELKGSSGTASALWGRNDTGT